MERERDGGPEEEEEEELVEEEPVEEEEEESRWREDPSWQASSTQNSPRVQYVFWDGIGTFSCPALR